jgi:hypothetical protein
VSAFADASAAVRRSRACTHVALRCAAGAALWKVAGMSGVQIGPARAGGTCQVSARYRIILHAFLRAWCHRVDADALLQHLRRLR